MCCWVKASAVGGMFPMVRFLLVNNTRLQSLMLWRWSWGSHYKVVQQIAVKDHAIHYQHQKCLYRANAIHNHFHEMHPDAPVCLLANATKYVHFVAISYKMKSQQISSNFRRKFGTEPMNWNVFFIYPTSVLNPSFLAFVGTVIPK